ncbi:hypothetical protein COV82_02390 [Candidatus Peregrinibacteria bacterium CG11_big_fil_rev_8_21_14_0_20_46_8]|nr:MAG: hypothetical protein COV82_02390 [Candidatus Peregrinibacteria bacterium CG11_big_fil_rev_8_21_14_0_20_46_8]
MNPEAGKIDWQYPAPRKKGFGAFIDRLVGPGATPAELWLQFGFAVAAGLTMLYFGLQPELGWNGWQVAVAAYLVFDICGGIATNATNAAKRWWHRKERQNFKSHMKFILPHFYMPLFIMLAFFPGQWDLFAIIYGYLVLGAIGIAQTPLYLRRPVAFILYTGALVMNAYLFEMPLGLEWFIPLLYLKLFMAHLIREAPYRPIDK